MKPTAGFARWWYALRASEVGFRDKRVLPAPPAAAYAGRYAAERIEASYPNPEGLE